MTDISKLNTFTGLNPWWSAHEVPSDLCGIKREQYLLQITKYLEKEEIELISGIRRSGKTTLLYQTIQHLIKEKKIQSQNILLVNCDEAIIKDKFEDLLEIVSTFNDSTEGKKYVFLDEIQYFENWEQQLKNLFDRFRKNVKLVVSGSSAMLSKSKNLYFLTGRFIAIHVYPFSFKEFLEIKGVELPEYKNTEDQYKKYVKLDLDKQLQQYLLYGGFPGIVLEDQKDEKFKTTKRYYETILYKDILKLWEVQDVTALEKIGRFLLQNVGQRFSYRKISDALQINLKTTQNYIDYLCHSFLIYMMEYYAQSSALQIKKEKKVFTIDNILHTAYYGSENIGSLAENLVFGDLIRRDFKVNYWKNKTEVDFVIEKEGLPMPIEVKYQQTINSEDFKGIYSFFKHYSKTKDGILITKNEFGQRKTEDGKTITLIPLWLYLLR